MLSCQDQLHIFWEVANAHEISVKGGIVDKLPSILNWVQYNISSLPLVDKCIWDEMTNIIVISPLQQLWEQQEQRLQDSAFPTVP